jgi:hypothetical protein
MKYKKKIKYVLWTFLCSFFILFIKTKLTGNPGRLSYSAISFEATVEQVPELLFISICFTVLFYFLIYRYIKED